MELPEMLVGARGDLSMRQAAALCDTDVVTYRAWEKGSSEPKPYRAPALARFLKIPEPEVLRLLGTLTDEQARKYSLVEDIPEEELRRLLARRPKRRRVPVTASATLGSDRGADLRYATSGNDLTRAA